MDFKAIIRILVITSLVIFTEAKLMASEITECKPFSEKELQIIRNSQNPKLLTGAALISRIGPASDLSRELFELASRIESPKGLATLSLIELEFDSPWIDSPLKPSMRESILNLLHDDKDNAQSYYLYALLQQEAIGDQEALSQIIKGNTKTFNSYSKQRFDAIVEAAEMEKCNGIQARQCASSCFFVTNTYSKLRNLCRKLIKSKGQTAKNACFVMGQKLEKGSLTFVEQIISLSIQMVTLDDPTSSSAAGIAIKKRVDNIKVSSSRAACISEADVPEDALLHYYEILLDKGEASAQDFLSEFTKQKQDKN
ncbi:MAG: hypothetical protein ABSF79_07365 [Smithellaceae bacterium]|jgi:hypothetical protein